MNVTFDTNCIIALDEDEDDAPYLRRIIQSAPEQGLTLRVVGISASERQRDGKPNIPAFEARVARVGLEGADILLPRAIWGMTFWGKSKWGSRQTKEEAKRIHEILFPDSPFGPVAQPLDGKWRNRRIDTEALWAHMHNGGGVFVTADGNFNKPGKKARLARLGAGEIMRPKEAAERLCPG